MNLVEIKLTAIRTSYELENNEILNENTTVGQ